MIGYCVCSSLGAEAKLKGEGETLTVRVAGSRGEPMLLLGFGSGLSCAYFGLWGGTAWHRTGRISSTTEKTLGATECFQTVGKLLSSSHQSCKQRRRRGHKFAKTLFKAENFSTSKKLSSPYFKTPSRSSSGTLDSLGGEGEVNLNYWGILRIAPRSTGWVGGTWAALCTELANIAVCLQAWQGWHCNVYLKWSLRPRGKFHVLGTFGNCVTASLSRASLLLWINLTGL